MNNAGTAVAERPAGSVEVIPASESAAILSLIERMATNPEISPERVERFIAMHDAMEAKRSKLAFSDAIAQSKAKISETPIIKNATGHNAKRYADFSAYAKVVDPVLASFGLTYRFRTTQANSISVTCILTGHGHEEENTLTGPADASGSKNAIQAIGSTLTYLQRYTLVQALGLAASEDDDGKAAGGDEKVSENDILDLQSLIDEVKADMPKFLKLMGVEFLDDLPKSRLKEAVSTLEAKRRQAAK